MIANKNKYNTEAIFKQVLIYMGDLLEISDYEIKTELLFWKIK